MEFQEVIRRRRSIRKFTDRRVDRETISRILEETAAFAPSSRNSRSTRFLAIDDPDLIARIAAMRDMKTLVTRFKTRNGAVECHALKGIGGGTPLRACNDCVADAAQFLEELLP